MNIKENVLFILFALFILAASYFWYTTWREPAVPKDSFNQTDIFGVDFLTMAARMKKIKLEAGFLQSSAFLSLKDLTPIIQLPEKTGRYNPFLPIDVKSESEFFEDSFDDFIDHEDSLDESF